MSYASIMVHVDRGPDSVHRIAVAADIADRFGAALTGIAARSPALTPFVEADGLNELALERVEAEVHASIREVERVFKEAIGRRNAVEFRSGVDQPLHFVTEQCRGADLIVVGRRGQDDFVDGRFGIDPGVLVLALGRPMLVVPPRAACVRAEHVVVAWKNTREARRAVLDSLPFLKRATDVAVVSVDEDDTGQGTDDVVDLLNRHGVNAETHRVLFPEKLPFDEIVDIVRARQADLIVAGAYGHTRFREWMFGGATRDLLRTTPVCCLMSH